MLPLWLNPAAGFPAVLQALVAFSAIVTSAKEKVEKGSSDFPLFVRNMTICEKFSIL